MGGVGLSIPSPRKIERRNREKKAASGVEQGTEGLWEKFCSALLLQRAGAQALIHP